MSVSEIKRVAIVGAGAIGSLIGALLARRTNVILVCREGHAAAISGHGLEVTGVDGFVQELRATTAPSCVAEADLVILTTKAFDLEPTLSQMGPHLSPDARVVLMQNGLGNDDMARAALPQATILRGLTYMGVTFTKPGHVVWTARGRTTIGAPFGTSQDSAEAVGALFREAGLETATSSDIRRDVWHKTLGNIGINALGAVMGMKNAKLVENAYTLAIMEFLVSEAERVAEAAGYAFNSFDEVVELARATGSNKNSMLQDVEAGRRTEIDFLNGAIVRLAKESGIGVPYNECLTRLVKARHPDAQ